MSIEEKDDQDLTPFKMPGASGESSSGEESGFVMPEIDTPQDEMITGGKEGPGQVIKKGGGGRKKDHKRQNSFTFEDSTDQSEDAKTENQAEQLSKEDASSPFETSSARPIFSEEATSQPGNTLAEGDTAPKEETEFYLGSEDAPVIEENEKKEGSSFLKLVNKVTTTLKFKQPQKEDSLTKDQTLAPSPSTPEDYNPPTGPVWIENTDRLSAPTPSENNTAASLERLDDLHSDEEELKYKKPTTGPVGKRQTGPLYRKRKTDHLELPQMELDNPKPAKEEDWVKSVTGMLMGPREETPTPPPEETEKVTSRLEGLMGEPVEPVSTSTEKPTPGTDKLPADYSASVEPETTANEPTWVSPFMSSGAGLTGKLKGTVPPQTESASQTESQSATGEDEEWQSFLSKLQSAEPDQEPELEAEMNTQDKFLNAISPDVSAEETESSESLAHLSDMGLEKDEEIGTAYWRVETEPLHLSEEPRELSAEMSASVSPFSFDEEDNLEDLAKTPHLEAPAVPDIQPSTPSSEETTPVSWDLSPEVQDMLQRSLLSEESPKIRSPFGGEDLSIPADQPITPQSFAEEAMSASDSDITGGSPKVPPLLALNNEEMPDFFTSPDQAPAVDVYKDTHRLGQAAETPTSHLFEDVPDINFFLPDSSMETKPLAFMDQVQPPFTSSLKGETQPSFEEEDRTKTSPLARRIEPIGAAESQQDEDLRSLFGAPSTSAAQPGTPSSVADEMGLHVEESAPTMMPPVQVPAKKAGLSNRSRILIAVGALAVFIVLVVVGVTGFFILRSAPLTVMKPQPKVEASVVEVAPMGLELTGGWAFLLQKGETKDGNWVPQGAEWLTGTELRRLVALPMNQQIEAVVKTLKPGDPVRLLMTNNDVLTYRVDKIETVTRDQADILAGNKPALIVILYQNNSDERLVVLCYQ